MEIELGELSNGFESDAFVGTSDEGDFLCHLIWFYDTDGFRNGWAGLFEFALMLKGLLGKI